MGAITFHSIIIPRLFMQDLDVLGAWYVLARCAYLGQPWVVSLGLSPDQRFLSQIPDIGAHNNTIFFIAAYACCPCQGGH